MRTRKFDRLQGELAACQRRGDLQEAGSQPADRAPLEGGYGGAREETPTRLKGLEEENGRLQRIVADRALDNAMLKELAEGK